MPFTLMNLPSSSKMNMNKFERHKNEMNYDLIP